MSTNRARLDALVSQCRHVLTSAAEQLASQESWDFSCPCVVLDARDPEVKAAVIGIGSVGNLVPTSAAIDSPEVREWLRIASEKSPEVAFTEMLNGDQQRAERFTQAYERLREERQSGIKVQMHVLQLHCFPEREDEATAFSHLKTISPHCSIRNQNDEAE